MIKGNVTSYLHATVKLISMVIYCWGLSYKVILKSLFGLYFTLWVDFNKIILDLQLISQPEFFSSKPTTVEIAIES